MGLVEENGSRRMFIVEIVVAEGRGFIHKTKRFLPAQNTHVRKQVGIIGRY